MSDCTIGKARYHSIAASGTSLDPHLAVHSRPVLAEQVRTLARSGFLYAIVDATDLPAVPPKMKEIGPVRAMSLFSGTHLQDHWAVAPYLVTIDETVLDWILQTLAAEPWGILVVSNQSPENIFFHFQSQLLVTLADGQQWFYRFYDPRVLVRHLERAQQGQIEAFFGPAQGFVLLDGPDGSGTSYALPSAV